MKLSKRLVVLALTSLASTGAYAAAYIGSFNTGGGFDGLLTPVTGFDVFSNGSAAFFCNTAAGCGAGIINGQQINPGAGVSSPIGTVITTYYQGVVSIVNPGTASPHMTFPGASPAGANVYQFTVAAKFDEVVIGTNPGLGQATLQPLNGGRVSLFYDNTSGGAGLPGTFINNTAGILAGVGYTDGKLIADGNTSQLLSLPTTVTSNGLGSASGSANVNGLITSSALGSLLPDVIGFIPQPGDFESTTTLQLSPSITGFQTVNFFDNANGWTAKAVNPALVERADANVDLSAVPEPESLALLGICFAAMGAVIGWGRKRV